MPTLLVLNKIDRVDAAGRAALADRYPSALQLSAKDPADVAALRERLIEQFAGKLEDAELDVPWAAQRVVHAIHERATVLAEQHHDAGTRLTIRAPSRVVSELRAALRRVVAARLAGERVDFRQRARHLASRPTAADSTDRRR